MSRKGRGSKNTYVTLAHTEYITDIIPSQDFTMQIDEPVQPGLPFLFPWLNTIARNFETYRCKLLLFHFRSTSADAVLSTVAPTGSTSLGSVIMMAQYNVLADPPTTKREMLNNSTATSCKPSNSMTFRVSPRASYKTLFIRTPYTPDTGDRRLYDLADFHLATEGMQGTTGSIGELSVTAIFTFTKPTLVNEVDPIDIFNWNSAYTPAAGGNALGWFQYELPVTTAIISPVSPQSTLKGKIMVGPQDGVNRYYFPDAIDNQIGSVYQIVMVAQCVPTAIGVQIFHHEYFSPDISTAPLLLLSNCALTTVGGIAGYPPTNTYFQDPSLLTSSTFVVNPTAPVLTRHISCMFFLKITGPNASFGPDDPPSHNNNVVFWRAFQANGTAYAPTGGMNFNRKVYISRVQYNGTG